MNVFSFADKVIEDALQKCDVIVNDDPAHVVIQRMSLSIQVESRQSLSGLKR